MRLCLACWSVRHTTLFHQMTFIVQFVSCGPIGRPAGITSSAAQTCSVREQGTRCLQMQILPPTLDVCDHMRALACGLGDGHRLWRSPSIAECSASNSEC